MVLFEPERTQFDLSWRMFGIPVRVHPMFWLAGCLLGAYWLERHGVWYLLLWIACMFVSILVHELGHVIAGSMFGSRSHIVLYAFGGLAIGSTEVRKRWQRIVVLLAGPGAGFLLLGLVLLVDWLVERPVVVERTLPWDVAALIMLSWMNLAWGILNLLPIWPLDGGQVSREVFSSLSPRNGPRLSLGISFLLATTLALHCLLETREIRLIPFLNYGGFFPAILFGMLAIESFQLLQQVRDRPPWGHDREPWERY